MALNDRWESQEDQAKVVADAGDARPRSITSASATAPPTLFMLFAPLEGVSRLPRPLVERFTLSGARAREREREHDVDERGRRTSSED